MKYEKDELRAMTKRSRKRDRPVMMASAMPSEKYSWPESSLMLSKGSTAMEGFDGSGGKDSGAVAPLADAFSDRSDEAAGASAMCVAPPMR